MAEFTVAGLRVLREVARTGSFSGAAQRLGYTQSAVSRQIALTEQVAGQALFERHARGVRPTEAGQLVLRRAEIVLAELDSTHHDLRHLDVREPELLRIGAFATAAAALVPRAIAALTAAAPRLRVRYRDGLSPALISAVARDRLDAAVVTGTPPPAPDVEVTPLLDDPLHVAVALGHPFAGRSSVPAAALRDQRWIAGSNEPGTSLLGSWSDSSWQPVVAYTARDWLAKLGMVSAGLGITVVPGLAVPALPADIAVARIDHPAAVRPTVLISRPGKGTITSALTDALHDATATVMHETRLRLHR